MQLSNKLSTFTPSALRAPLRVLRRTEHCAPLTRHGLAFSQPSKDLVTPPVRGTVQSVSPNLQVAGRREDAEGKSKLSGASEISK